jgi:hypothetical protein
MNLSLSTPEGDAVEVVPVDMPEDVKASADAFHRAQANEPLAGEKMQPPKRKPRPVKPTEDDKSEAPRRGRPRNDDKPRTTDKAPAEKLPPKDLTQELNAIADGAWLSVAFIPVIGPYSAIVHNAQPQLVAALNAGAQVNPGLRSGIEKAAAGGGNLWMVQLAGIAVQIGMQAMQLMKDSEYRALVDQSNKAEAIEYAKRLGLIAEDMPASEGV